MIRFFISTIVMTLVLFMYGSLAQVLPWGIPTVQVVFSGESPPEAFQTIASIQRFGPGEFTTEKFAPQFAGQISTLSTDETFSWIVTTQIANYNPFAYLFHELLTQLLVAALLSTFLTLTVSVSNNERFKIVLVLALGALTATYIQQMNWWNVPASYQLGMIANVLISWSVAVFISAKWILKPAE